MIVEGKSGRRAVRLASQARKILDDKPFPLTLLTMFSLHGEGM
jgi:hypothetical protein